MTTGEQPVVTLQDASVHYGPVIALNRVTLSVPAGATGLVGRNGAGKSSLLRLLLGLVKPVTGSGTVMGVNLSAGGGELRRTVGYMPENDALVPGLRGLDQVALAGELCGLSRREAIRRAHEVFALVDLSEARYRPVEQYSTGTRQRLKLAVALVHDPSLLLLDEPTVGLDPPNRQRLLELLDELVRKRGKSLIISTHLLGDIEHGCSHVVMLDRGTIVASGPLRETLQPVDNRLLLAWQGSREPFVGLLRERGLQPADDAAGLSGRLSGSATAHEDQDDFHALAVTLPDSFDRRQLFRWAAECQARLRTIQPHAADLATVYHQLVREPADA